MDSKEQDDVCAYCGKAAVDNVKLKKCGCKLVKYCSVDCQKSHRSQHKQACKKRLAEIKDDDLFRQPDESHLGECPICCLPLSIEMSKSALSTCCSKVICIGCAHATQLREAELGPEQRCAFCREPMPKTDDEIDQNVMKRVKANDPVALYQMGVKCGQEGDYEGAIEYLAKAAELGNIDAHYSLSVMFREEKGVAKDKKKEVYHLEEAAIGGHPKARYNLALEESRNGSDDRAAKHLVIAAKLGLDEALEGLKKGFMDGYASKEDFEAALRGHQSAVDATKSAQREKAEKHYTKCSM
jgi:tetratricopeptide (TPR) repeat protein